MTHIVNGTRFPLWEVPGLWDPSEDQVPRKKFFSPFDGQCAVTYKIDPAEVDAELRRIELLKQKEKSAAVATSEKKNKEFLKLQRVEAEKQAKRDASSSLLASAVGAANTGGAEGGDGEHDENKMDLSGATPSATAGLLSESGNSKPMKTAGASSSSSKAGTATKMNKMKSASTSEKVLDKNPASPSTVAMKAAKKRKLENQAITAGRKSDSKMPAATLLPFVPEQQGPMIADAGTASKKKNSSSTSAALASPMIMSNPDENENDPEHVLENDDLAMQSPVLSKEKPGTVDKHPLKLKMRTKNTSMMNGFANAEPQSPSAVKINPNVNLLKNKAQFVKRRDPWAEKRFCVPTACFKRMLKNSILKETKNTKLYKLNLEAVLMLQEAGERFLTGVMEDCNVCAKHGKRKTVMSRDLMLTMRIRGQFGWAANKDVNRTYGKDQANMFLKPPSASQPPKGNVAQLQEQDVFGAVTSSTSVGQQGLTGLFDFNVTPGMTAGATPGATPGMESAGGRGTSTGAVVVLDSDQERAVTPAGLNNVKRQDMISGTEVNLMLNHPPAVIKTSSSRTNHMQSNTMQSSPFQVDQSSAVMAAPRPVRGPRQHLPESSVEIFNSTENFLQNLKSSNSGTSTSAALDKNKTNKHATYHSSSSASAASASGSASAGAAALHRGRQHSGGGSSNTNNVDLEGDFVGSLGAPDGGSKRGSDIGFKNGLSRSKPQPSFLDTLNRQESGFSTSETPRSLSQISAIDENEKYEQDGNLDDVESPSFR